MDPNTALAAVDELIAAGAEFASIEAYIEQLSGPLIDSEVRSALWLIAWCETSPAARREAILELWAAKRLLLTAAA